MLIFATDTGWHPKMLFGAVMHPASRESHFSAMAVLQAPETWAGEEWGCTGVARTAA